MSTVLALNEEKIIYECENSKSITGYRPSQKYLELLLKFVEVLCHRKFRSKIVNFVSQNYFPIEESLKICEERGALEACAVLYKRSMDYFKAIEKYTQVLVDTGVEIVHTLLDVLVQDSNTNEYI